MVSLRWPGTGSSLSTAVFDNAFFSWVGQTTQVKTIAENGMETPNTTYQMLLVAILEGGHLRRTDGLIEFVRLEAIQHLQHLCIAGQLCPIRDVRLEKGNNKGEPTSLPAWPALFLPTESLSTSSLHSLNRYGGRAGFRPLRIHLFQYTAGVTRIVEAEG